MTQPTATDQKNITTSRPASVQSAHATAGAGPAHSNVADGGSQVQAAATHLLTATLPPGLFELLSQLINGALQSALVYYASKGQLPTQQELILSQLQQVGQPTDQVAAQQSLTAYSPPPNSSVLTAGALPDERPAGAVEDHHAPRDPRQARNQRRREKAATGIVYGQLEGFSSVATAILDQAKQPVEPVLRPGCQLVLTVLLAWQNFAIFRERGWLVLAFERICKELKGEYFGKVEYLFRALRELNRTGIIEIGRWETGFVSKTELDIFRADCALFPARYGEQVGSWWTGRGLQRTHIGKGGQERAGTNIYRLRGWALEVAGELPQFDPTNVLLAQRRAGIKPVRAGNYLDLATQDVLPGLEGSSQMAGRTLEVPQKYLIHIPPEAGSTSEVRWEEIDVLPQVENSLEVPDQVEPTYFPRPHDHDLIHDEDEGTQELPIKEEGTALTAEQKEALYHLLDLQKTLTGYQGEWFDQETAQNLVKSWSFEEIRVAGQALTSDWKRSADRINSPPGLFLKKKLPQARQKLAGQVQGHQGQGARPNYRRSSTQPGGAGGNHVVNLADPKYSAGGKYGNLNNKSRG